MAKCYSVRLESLSSISTKAYLATAFDGSTAIIPKSQVYGRDWDIMKSEAYWISEWILSKKPELQASTKKWTVFNKSGKDIGRIEFKHHTPKKITKEVSHDGSLTR